MEHKPKKYITENDIIKMSGYTTSVVMPSSHYRFINVYILRESLEVLISNKLKRKWNNSKPMISFDEGEFYKMFEAVLKK